MSSPDRHVVPFRDVGHASLPMVGGKGANLGALTAAGLPVPGGFCVTTDAYTDWLAAARPGLFSMLVGVGADDLAGLSAACERLRDELGTLPIPGDVARAIGASLAETGIDRPYAVRSSATAEDLPDASFAGQQDTWLNVIGPEAILDAVRRCWISLFTDRAVLYRVEHGFPHDVVKLAVVVQRMVLPDVAGILFTADPISGRRDRIHVDAGFGLGEALVGGLVSADLFEVDKATRSVVTRKIADKHLRIVPLPTGGTVEEELHGDERTRPSLTDDDVLRLADLGMRIEARQGAPQDVEWCMEDGELFVVQSRPITTLYPMPSPRPKDGRLHVYVCTGHIQGMIEPIPPLALSMLEAIYPFGKVGDDELDKTYFTVAGGRLYHDVTELLSVDVFRDAFPSLLKMSDPLMGLALGQVIARDEFDRGSPGDRAYTWQGLLFRMRRLGFVVLTQVLQAPEGAIPERAAGEDDVVLRTRGRLAEAGDGPRLAEVAIAELGAIYERVRPRWFGPIFASIFAKLALDRMFPGDADLEALVRAMPHNVVTEKDLALARIAVRVVERGHGALVDDGSGDGASRMDGASSADVLDRLRTADPVLRDAIDGWFAAYGCRGPGEFDVSRPRYADDPGPVVAALHKLVSGPRPPEDVLAEHQRLSRDGDAAIGRLAAKAPPLQRPLVKAMARIVRHLTAARERPKHHGLRIAGVVRASMVAEGERLAAAGVLDDAADIWFLRLQELRAGLPGDVRGLVATRKAEHARHAAMTPPRVLTSEGESVVAAFDRGDAPDGVLVGTSASAGVVEGVARVLTDPKQALGRGEILVTRFTDPGWTPLFAVAGGLVMEVGGQMTHGSVIAREYGIPAVVCVTDATKVLRDGQRVRVDGDRGWVQVVDG